MIDLDSALEELKSEHPELAEAVEKEDEEEVRGFLSSLAKKAGGSKLIKAGALFIAITVGGLAVAGSASAAGRVDHESMYSDQEVVKIDPVLGEKQAAPLLMKMSPERSGLSITHQAIVSRVLLKNGLPKVGETIQDYVNSGNLTNVEIKTVIDFLASQQ